MGVTNYQIVAGDNVDLVVDDNAKTVTIDVTDSASNFTDLLDVPASYTGAELKLVRVNAGADALEFVDSGDIEVEVVTDATLTGTGTTLDPLSVVGGSGLNEVQAIAYSASITPDISSGNVVNVGVLTGDITVNNPTNTTEGQEIYIRFEQDGTGGRDVTLGANFVLLDSNTSYDQSPSAVFYFTGLTKDAGIIEGGFSPVVGTQVASEINAADSKTTPVDADEIPLVDSAASYVLKKLTWANLKATLLAYFLPFFSRPNILINTNGLSPINQSGATTVANGAYGFDMWKLAHDCDTVTISATATGMRHTVTTKGEGTSCIPYQIVEGFASFKGKTVTISASVISNQAGTALRISDGVGTATSATTHTGGGTAETLTATLSVSASATKVWAEGIIGATGLADGDYIEWAWIKLEEGSVATPYAVPSKSIELYECKRRFERLGKGWAIPVYASSAVAGGINYQVEKIVAPTVTLNDTSITAYQIAVGTNTSSGSTLTLNGAAGVNGFSFSLNGWDSCWTVDQRHVILEEDCFNVDSRP